MFEPIEIHSHTGSYRAHFVEDGPAQANALVSDSVHFLVDRRVAELYRDRLRGVLSVRSVLLIDADEAAKSLERMPGYILHLARHAFRRGQRLIAIGGGVVQDITCFLAATMMRGTDWSFVPTTLLAQADSCIGSKSSINVGEFKNLVGTFTPPRDVFIDVGFLDTLDDVERRSGVGEILKVHAIDGSASFRRLAADYDKLFRDKPTMTDYVRRALMIKKPYIEEDEFDRAARQIFNYGHSFGHALESATAFAIPHGIAVTMGMDLANYAAWQLDLAKRDTFEMMHPVLSRNFQGFQEIAVPAAEFFGALAHDKKNVGASSVTVIFPDAAGKIAKTIVPLDLRFRDVCLQYLASGRVA